MARLSSTSVSTSPIQEEEGKEEVSAWRRDPESSFSDWTIRVIRSSNENAVVTGVTNFDGGSSCDVNDRTDTSSLSNALDSEGLGDSHCDDEEVTYHVHRVYLASGPRKSEYFRTLFSLTTNTQEKVSRTTTLELPESSCSIFPVLLDYIYSGETEENTVLCGHFGDSIDVAVLREAVALYFLADYLQIQKLIPITKKLVQNLLSDVNVHFLCREALMYGIDWIIDDCIMVASWSPRDFFAPTTETGSPASCSPSTHPNTPLSHTAPPASQTFDMLPLERQAELLKLSLSHTLRELGRFKRVPSRWKDDIDDVVATHMPTLMLSKESGENENRIRDYRLPAQGCGLPFPDNRMCPLFYFDRDRDHTTPVASPLAQSQPSGQAAINVGSNSFET
ncbi:unnamed protein product [Pseudo-nitzschia multistriata]|uniref:BTB domain-containing protein n=1 Tax=Pseudo-nitzschia multistriata TaxID=183589 RepID=A0A448ZII9_9STRA|nr:unnamed protein product [Pseudo-nitzschia multistriata]